jgi:hypothetical protein
MIGPTLIVLAEETTFIYAGEEYSPGDRILAVASYSRAEVSPAEFEIFDNDDQLVSFDTRSLEGLIATKDIEKIIDTRTLSEEKLESMATDQPTVDTQSS